MTASARVSKSRAKRLEGGAKRVEVILDECALENLAVIRQRYEAAAGYAMPDAEIIRAALQTMARKMT